MPLLLLTFFEIALLRKGPEHLPRSSVFLVAAAMFWFAAILATWMLLTDFSGFDVLVSVISNLLSLALYGLFISARGKGARLTQAVTAILGATGCIAWAMLAWFLIAQPTGNTLAINLVPLLLWFWSVQVEGHIVSRATDISLLSGVGIAAFVFVIQFLFTDFLSALQQAAPPA